MQSWQQAAPEEHEANTFQSNNHGNTMEICLHAVHHARHKLHKWKTPSNADSKLFTKELTHAAQVENITSFWLEGVL